MSAGGSVGFVGVEFTVDCFTGDAFFAFVLLMINFFALVLMIVNLFVLVLLIVDLLILCLGPTT